MKIGMVRVDSFKKMAWAMKKSIEGCKHRHALENLARACGMKNYHEVLEIRENGLATNLLMQGSRDELIAAWTERITKAFGFDVETIFTAEELDMWFTRVFVDRARLVSDVDADDALMKEVRDPRLETASWHDAEFRQWLQGVVEREMPTVRPLADDEGDGDGADDTTNTQGGTRGRSSAASAAVEE